MTEVWEGPGIRKVLPDAVRGHLRPGSWEKQEALEAKKKEVGNLTQL